MQTECPDEIQPPDRRLLPYLSQLSVIALLYLSRHFQPFTYGRICGTCLRVCKLLCSARCPPGSAAKGRIQSLWLDMPLYVFFIDSAVDKHLG